MLFLSDHGEAFYEHGVMGHGWDLYREVLQVPLLLQVPGGEPGRVSALATHLDVAPTLLALAGLPVPPGLPGRDLRALAAEAPPPTFTGQRPVISYQDYEGRTGASLALGPWHLIEPLSARFAPATELYDRAADPREQSDLAGRHPVLRGYLRHLLRQHLEGSRGMAPAAVTLDAETRRRLEGLGYLNP